MTETLGTMKKRIARRVRNASSATASGIETDITEAIIEAIDYRKHERFWFNEQDATASTVAGQEFYALPADYISGMNLKCVDSSGNVIIVQVRAEAELDEWNQAGITGMPKFFCIHNEQLRLSPIPDQVYTLNLSYVRDILITEPLSSDGDTNAWVTLAAAMVRYHAQSIIWFDIARNSQKAIEDRNQSESHYRVLTDRTRNNAAGGVLVGQDF